MCLVNTNRTFCLLGSVILLKTDSVDNRFLCYALKSPEINNYLGGISGSTAQQAIYLRDIKNVKISIPSYLEQIEIVRIIDDLFEKELHAKELCDVIEIIDLMKKSILARAFRGELSTNNPNEESALELLKEVLKEKN
jgi:type I restriction enzyme S subunit